MFRWLEKEKRRRNEKWDIYRKEKVSVNMVERGALGKKVRDETGV